MGAKCAGQILGAKNPQNRDICYETLLSNDDKTTETDKADFENRTTLLQKYSTVYIMTRKGKGIRITGPKSKRRV